MLSLAVVPKVTDIKGINDIIGDIKLTMFFLEWLKTGRNATQAYRNLHPTADDHSCRVLGSTTLAKISIPLVLDAMGLGVDKYMSQLTDGLMAEKKAVLRKYDRKTGALLQELDLSGPDHKVRRLYHEPLGRMLNLEKDKNIGVQLNQINIGSMQGMIEQSRRERGLTP